MEAIAALRETILLDWSYWSICATDAVLDPIRIEVNELLKEMREGQKKAAQRLLDEINALVSFIEKEYDDLDLADRIASTKDNYSDLLKLYQTGVVFNYLAILKLAPPVHEALIRGAERACESTIAKYREKLTLAEDAQKRDATERRQEAETRRAEGRYMISLADKPHEARDGWGCFGLFLWVFFAYWTIWLWNSGESGTKAGALWLAAGLIILGIVLYKWIASGTKGGRARNPQRVKGKRLIEEAEAELVLSNQKDTEEEAALSRTRASFEEMTWVYLERIRVLQDRQSEAGAQNLSNVQPPS